jgi:hypothetical protein
MILLAAATAAGVERSSILSAAQRDQIAAGEGRRDDIVSGEVVLCEHRFLRHGSLFWLWSERTMLISLTSLAAWQ